MPGRNDPYGAFNFLIELDGAPTGGFSEVSGLSTETDVIEYRNGDDVTGIRKLPGLPKYADITLKRGFTQSRDLWEWRRTVINGQTERRSGRIIVLSEAREPVLRFRFNDGWPSRWDGPALDAMSKGVAIETLVISHEGLRLDD